MHERIKKTKKHVYEHKLGYLTSSFVLAGFTMLIMRGRHAGMQSVPDEDRVLNQLFVRPFNFFSNGNTINNIVSVVERDGRGHPGYVVRSLETKEIFLSQKKAAEAFGIPTTVISDHLRGKFENANGYHFERIAAL